MARIADPWKWDARKGWYAWVKGRRVRLASFGEGKRVANARLNDLLGAGEGGVPPVGELVLKYIQDLRARRDAGAVGRQTRGDAERRLAGFAEMHGSVPSDRVKPHHVDSWLETKTGWGKTSRHDGVGAVKSVFRWAVRKGHVDHNPLEAAEKPKRAGRREVIPSQSDVGTLFAAEMTPELAELLAFIHETGCRPKEARTAEARHVDFAAGVVVLAEHKTAARTGRRRVLYLTPVAAGIAARLAALRPEGPIFLNSRGRPWTKDALASAVSRLRRRTGLGPEVVAYGLRHLFATDALARQVPVALVAELMGHSDLRMMSTYSHVSERHDALRDAMARARPGGDGGSLPPLVPEP